MARLDKLPADIVQQLVPHVLLEDIVTLFQTCRALRNMSDVKSFWISALESTRRIRPLPLPHRTDLSTLALDDLKRAAFYAVRLHHNWSSSRPHPTSSIRRFLLREDIETVCIVPGADIVMLFDSPSLIVFDSAKMQIVKELHIGDIYWAVSRAYYEGPGQLLVGIAVSDIDFLAGPNKLILIEVTYGSDLATNAVMRYNYELENGLYETFVYSDVMGFLWVDNYRILRLTAWNIDTSLTVDIDTGLKNEPDSQFEYTIHIDQGHLFLTYEDPTSISTIRFSAELLPYGHLKPSSNVSCDKTLAPINRSEMNGLYPGFPNSYGIVGISVRTSTTVLEEDYKEWLPSIYVIHTDPDDVLTPVVCFLATTLVSPLLRKSMQHKCVGSVRATCSFYLLSNPNDNRCRIQLVRFGPSDNPSHEHIIELDEDCGIEQDMITGMTSDDYMGVLYLTYADGSLFVLRFA